MKELFIFDFDGVIAFLFEKYDLSNTRRELLESLLSFGLDASNHGNMFTVSELIDSSSLDDHSKHEAFLSVDRILRKAELEAVENAEAVPGLEEVLPKVIGKGIDVAVASNNNPEAVGNYFRKHFPGLDIPIYGRDPLRPEHLKPSPYMLEMAMEHYDAKKENTIFFGDAVSDMEAAMNAGVGFYGFIPSEKKRLRMEKVLPDEKLLPSWYALEEKLLK